MKTNVAIYQPQIAPYRIALFSRLAKNKNVKLVIFSSTSEAVEESSMTYDLKRGSCTVFWEKIPLADRSICSSILVKVMW